MPYCVPVDVTNVADVALVVVLSLLFVSQLREGIDDDTE